MLFDESLSGFFGQRVVEIEFWNGSLSGETSYHDFAGIADGSDLLVSAC